MKPYDVTIRAYAEKTIRVYADSEMEAILDAHTKFPIDWDNFDDGDQETFQVTKPELITGE
jgi:hypothetical protein